MNNEFFNTGQEIITGQDIDLMDERHEQLDPISNTDTDGIEMIVGNVRNYREKGIPHCLTHKDEFLYLWVIGAEIGMPDDGGDPKECDTDAR